MKYTFNCPCGLTDQQVYDDIATLVKLTGYESQAEMDMLHHSIYHDDLYWDDTDFHGTETPTVKELAINAKKERKRHQRCCICPPNKGENASRRAKHGTKKPKYKAHRRK